MKNKKQNPSEFRSATSSQRPKARARPRSLGKGCFGLVSARTHARVSPARAQVQPTRAPGTARGAPPSAATRRRGTAPGFYPSAPARPSAVLHAEAGRSAPCSGITALLFSRSVVPDLWRPHGLQRARLPCPPLRSTAGKSSAVSKGFLPFTKPRAVHKTQLTK